MLYAKRLGQLESFIKDFLRILNKVKVSIFNFKHGDKTFNEALGILDVINSLKRV